MKTNVSIVIMGIIFILMFGKIGKIEAQTKVSTETTLCYDKLQSGIPLNRLEITNPQFNLMYDYKNDFNGKPVDDVLGIIFPKIINKKTFSLDANLIKLGDWNKHDQIVFDLSATKQFNSIAITLEVGRAIGMKTKPWDFVISRLANRLITIEGGILSPDQLFSSSPKKLYGWFAYHPEHFFAATGNEISRNWLLFGTKKYADFGNFSFFNYDRKNGNFWFRSQFGFQDVNQKFFEQDNYIIATSYLVIPPFFYKHFGPMSTKGKYALKFDGKRVGKGLETYEISVGHQFGKFGQIAIGGINKNFNKNLKAVFEYYNEFKYYKDLTIKTEFRYELPSKFYGYVTLSYQLK